MELDKETIKAIKFALNKDSVNDRSIAMLNLNYTTINQDYCYEVYHSSEDSSVIIYTIESKGFDIFKFKKGISLK